MADEFKLRLILAVHQQGPPPGGYKTGIPHPYNKFFYKDTTLSSEPRAAQKVRFLPAAGEEFLPDNLDWYPERQRFEAIGLRILPRDPNMDTASALRKSANL